MLDARRDSRPLDGKYWNSTQNRSERKRALPTLDVLEADEESNCPDSVHLPKKQKQALEGFIRAAAAAYDMIRCLQEESARAEADRLTTMEQLEDLEEEVHSMDAGSFVFTDVGTVNVCSS